jgi:hypothetical protein
MQRSNSKYDPGGESLPLRSSLRARNHNAQQVVFHDKNKRLQTLRGLAGSRPTPSAGVPAPRRPRAFPNLELLKYSAAPTAYALLCAGIR